VSVEPPRDRPGGPRLRETVWSDLRRGDHRRTLGRDLKEIYRFYLDDATRGRLRQMGRLKRALYLTIWVAKSMILKLTATRRLLLLLSMVLFVVGRNDQGGAAPAGFLGVLLVLLLELKDKLLAQDELAVGHAVQRALMPRCRPELAGWDIWLFTRPANEVGGDLVDYLALDDRRLGVTLGDVAGKGLGAALLMAKLQATLRALATATSSLEQLGKRLNEIFCRDGLPDRFASLIYCHLDADSDELHLLNAGHLPAIAIRGDRLEKMPRGAAALGLMPKTRYREQTVALAPGETLLLYSDGLTDSRSEAGEFFGDERLSRLLEQSRGLEAEEVGNTLRRAVDQFAGDAPQNDDLSMVVLRRAD